MSDAPHGFRTVGSVFERRRLVDHAAAFAAYCACDERAGVDREAYLSAFRFGDDFRRHLEESDSTAGFAGACWADYLPFDLDREDDLDAALADAVKLTAGLAERYGIDPDSLLLFFSGRKGFAILVPTSLWAAEPSDDFHRIARQFAEQAATRFGVRIDSSVYAKVQPFRAPNSRHPKSGLHKRRLTFDELSGLTVAGILDLAREPMPFDPPALPPVNATALADWQAAAAAVKGGAEGKEKLRAAANSSPTLNRLTLEFIRAGAGEGDRHRRAFSAAANLAEFGCSPALAHALLTDAALDCGLAPKDVRRQIDCGLALGKASEPGAAADTLPTPEATIPSGCPPPDLQAQLAALWAGAQAPATAPAVESEESPAEPESVQVIPPAGATLYFQDARGRPCNPADSAIWTWAGATQWYRTAETPIPCEGAAS